MLCADGVTKMINLIERRLMTEVGNPGERREPVLPPSIAPQKLADLLELSDRECGWTERELHTLWCQQLASNVITEIDAAM